MLEELLHKLIKTSKEAGKAILDIYTSEFDVSYKADSSPLTEADRLSHEILEGGIAIAEPGTPIISEEGRSVDYPEREGWSRFYLIDPLDGTKEFINKNGEFTVNIALISDGRPVLGIIHVPVLGITYYGAEGRGAFRQRGNETPDELNVRSASADDGLVVVASRSHPSAELETFLERIRIKERVSRGSSLKFCMVAEGSADIYPRLGPTWEWDTAAGHAILEAAGGHVLSPEGQPIIYNKKSLKHNGFIALGRLDTGFLPVN